MKIQFVQEPGYIHDLFYIFMLAYKTADAGSEEYAEIMQDTFGACPAELYTFFYPREDGETFMTSLYAEELASGRSGGVASLLEDLQDEDEVFRRFLQFYFPHFEEADSSVHSISRHIYESAYSDTLKFHLLSLCVDPAGHIRLLVKELQEKERLLKKYTEENFSVLLNLQAGLEPESLFRLLCPEEKMNDQNLEYSLSLLDKGLIQVQKRARYLLLLGCEYENNRLLRAIRFPEPDLVQFGKVMSEANRYKILEMLLERGELCTADIAKEWDTSVTLVYYHLEMMSSTGLLKSRNAGRTIFYSINAEYFRRVAVALQKYNVD